MSATKKISPFATRLVVLACAALLSSCAMVDPGSGVPLVEQEQKASVSTLAHQMTTNDSVQVYSLDDGAPVLTAPQTDAPAQASFSDQQPAGVPATSDPSVTVYPFDDAPTDTSNGITSQPLTPPPQLSHSQHGGLTFAPQADIPAQQQGSPSTRVYFAHNSAALSRVAVASINSVAHEAGPIHIEGHASTRAATSDPVARSIINLKVSMNRALSVSRQMIHDGVPPSSIVTTALGDTQSPPPDTGKSTEAASRRVDIYTATSSSSSIE